MQKNRPKDGNERKGERDDLEDSQNRQFTP